MQNENVLPAGIFCSKKGRAKPILYRITVPRNATIARLISENFTQRLESCGTISIIYFVNDIPSLFYCTQFTKHSGE